MKDDKENIGQEFENTLKFIFNHKKENIKKNIQSSFASTNEIVTYNDFKKRYTEKEAKKLLKKDFNLSSEELEEELNIIYHQLDTDLSLPFLYYTNRKRETDS